MAKNDNSNAVRLIESLNKHAGSENVNAFSENYQLSKAASIEKRFEWAESVCNYLTSKYDNETVKQIRMDCACGPELGKGKKLKEIYEKEDNIPNFIEKANKLNQGFTIEYNGTCFYLIYPQCYCSCVKRINKNLPESWCYCTLGYTKKMFEFILSKEVQVELINSVKKGDNNCKIKIIV